MKTSLHSHSRKHQQQVTYCCHRFPTSLESIFPVYQNIDYSSSVTISTRLQDVENALTSRVKLDRSTFLRLKESLATIL